MKINPRIAKPLIIALTAILLILLPGLRLPYLDTNTDSYFKSSISKAGVAYGVCRGVNAAVSVVKESQLNLEPGGLGVSLAAGQVLDPLDDLAERASDILITAIVSLGIQKIAYELGVAYAPPLIGAALLLLLLLSLIRHEKAGLLRGLLLRAMVLLAVARLCLPVASLASGYLQDHYFGPQVSQARNDLSLGSPELDKLKELRLPEVDGVIGTMKNSAAFVTEKTVDFAAALKALAQNMGNIIDNLLKLAYLYAALFLVQVILLPLLAFWILARLAHSLFDLPLLGIIRHADILPACKKPKEAGEA